MFHSFTLAPAGPVAVGPVGPARPDPVPVAAPPVAPKPVAALVRPPERPFPITPTKAAAKTEVKLPGPADAACRAGGGRFVLFRIPKLRQVAALDVSEGKVVKYVPLPEDGALVAGGMSHLYILAPTANVIQRWSLRTFEKEATVPNPAGGQARALLMGHASDGPLLVVGPNTFLDGKTLQEVKPAGEVGGRGMGALAGHPRYPPLVRVSADGRVYAWATLGLSPSGLSSMVLGDGGAKSYYEHRSVGPILPGPDGTLFAGGGPYTPDLKVVGGPKGAGGVLMPAAHGPYYLEYVPPPSTPFRTPGVEPPTPGFFLRMLGESRPVADLGVPAGLDLSPDRPGAAPRPPVSDRLFFVPAAKAMVVLYGTGDEVVIHAVDVDDLLGKSGIEYLFVTSKPPAAERGTAFAYAPTVKSKRGGVTLKLDAGPEGMRVVGDKVVWEVPRDFAADEVSVILTVADAGGREAFHAFTLPVGGGR